MSEPLHVRVARALGWTDVQSLGPRQHGPAWHRAGTDLWTGRPPKGAPVEAPRSPCAAAVPASRGEWCCSIHLTSEIDGGCPLDFEPLPPYGEESPYGWACTGPLIEKHGIEITFTRGLGRRAEASGYYVDGPDVLTAVCGVVLTLAEAGRLERKG